MNKFLVLCIIIILASNVYSLTRFSRKTENETSHYLVDQGFDTFNDAVYKCDMLNANLPSIHSQDDLDFLANIVKLSGVHEDHTWIGLKKTDNKCDTYMDGSPADYNFRYFLNLTCSACVGDCALQMSNEVYNWKQVLFVSKTQYNSKARTVCVFKCSD